MITPKFVGYSERDGDGYYEISESASSRPVAVRKGTRTSKVPFPHQVTVGVEIVCLSKEGVKELIHALTELL